MAQTGACSLVREELCSYFMAFWTGIHLAPVGSWRVVLNEYLSVFPGIKCLKHSGAAFQLSHMLLLWHETGDGCTGLWHKGTWQCLRV